MRYLLVALILCLSVFVMLIFLTLDIHPIWQWALGWCSGLITAILMVLDK